MVSARPHLTAILGATAVIAILLAVVLQCAFQIEKRSLRAEAAQTFSIKNQGVVLQRLAFREPGLLPFYGSSELVKDVSDKAANFFSRAPTGFEVFPVGKAGTASLIALEKLGAVGADLRGRKIAFSISPSWFWAVTDNPHHYAGNFSLEQVNALVFEAPLDRELQRDIARRVLEFPDTLDRSPLLAFALRRLAGDSWLDRIAYGLAYPIGRAEGAVMRLQDHALSVAYLLRRVERPFAWRHHPSTPKWARLLNQTERDAEARDDSQAENAIARTLASADTEATFRSHIAKANEWRDLELLLRTMRQLGARPLLLSMPLGGPVFDRLGISAQARAMFYDHLEELAARYDAPLVDFRDHDTDRQFLADSHDHLSTKGWLYFDAALDAFYHERPISTVLASSHRVTH